MASKASLYFHTVKNMKPSQIAARLKIMIGIGNSLGVKATGKPLSVQRIASVSYTHLMLPEHRVEQHNV